MISIILDEMTSEIKVYIKITLPKITATIDRIIKSVANNILLIGIPVYLFIIFATISIPPVEPPA